MDIDLKQNLSLAVHTCSGFARHRMIADPGVPPGRVSGNFPTARTAGILPQWLTGHE